MAEEQITAQASQPLILSGNQEKLMKRIENVELELRDEILERQKIAFFKVFAELCKRYFKLRRSDLLKIADIEELSTLELEVFKKAERWSKLTKYFGMPFMALIPIFGWFILLDWLYCDYYNSVHDLYAFHYCKLRRLLVEKEGKEFFSFETLKQVLTN